MNIQYIDESKRRAITKILHWEKEYFGKTEQNIEVDELRKLINNEIVLGVFDTVVDSSLVAYFILEEQEAENVLYLSGMAINPDMKGQGKAKEAMQLMIDEMVDENWAVIMLSVDISNVSAIKLYESVGFNILKEIIDPEYFEGETFYLMQKVI